MPGQPWQSRGERHTAHSPAAHDDAAHDRPGLPSRVGALPIDLPSLARLARELHIATAAQLTQSILLIGLAFGQVLARAGQLRQMFKQLQ